MITCAACQFFDVGTKTCRRYAPRPENAGPGPTQTEAMWPRVNETDGCGDGVAKP